MKSAGPKERLSAANIFILSILTSRRQLENPGHYEDLENYYHSYKNCVLRNNYIPSPTYEKLPGLDEIPVLKVLTYLHLFFGNPVYNVFRTSGKIIVKIVDLEIH